ncbi:NUDIX hydrolase [Candidatus Leptofilum sp.]|uniref:NUDIX hydrolase n=1 Tax=Candidatus Leptofilum sp. TaxID=3241576 RepID=UPI003B5939EC
MHQLDWKVLNSEYLLRNEWIAVRADTCEMGNGRLIDPYYIMESSDYVNIVPVTAVGEIVFVRIYRHGVVQTLLETPGGLIDDGESPLAAARRELLEETGCDCAEMQLIGSGSPDPARMSCHAYYFLATGVVETAVPTWDAHEEMELLKLPIAEAKRLLFAGEIVDSVQQSALFFALHALGELGS